MLWLFIYLFAKKRSNKSLVCSVFFIIIILLFSCVYCLIYVYRFVVLSLSHTELTRFGYEMMLCKANDQDLIKVWSSTMLIFILSSAVYVRSRIEITGKCFWKFDLFSFACSFSNTAQKFTEIKHFIQNVFEQAKYVWDGLILG